MWVAFQKGRERADGDLSLEKQSQDEQFHSVLVMGYWTAINRNGECCTVHKDQLAQLDRMMHASRESLIKVSE